MTQNRTTPGWGKAIGILMIVFGGLGVFIQIYKMMIPQIAKMQRQILDSASTFEARGIPNSNEIFREMTRITENQANILLYGGLIGLIACTCYIVGGAKLLKATSANYHFAKFSLMGFLILNSVTAALLMLSGPSVLVLGALVYVILGLVTDLVLFIILLASDRTSYGIGQAESNEIDTVYDQREIL